MVLSSVPWVPTILLKIHKRFHFKKVLTILISYLVYLKFLLHSLLWQTYKKPLSPLNSSLPSPELSVGCQSWASRIGSFLGPACPKLSPQSHSSTTCNSTLYLSSQYLHDEFNERLYTYLFPQWPDEGQRWLYLGTSLSSLPEVYSSLSFPYI